MKRLFFLVVFLLLATLSFASHGNLLPIMDPLEKLIAFLSGPVIKIIATLVIMGAGIMFFSGYFEGIKNFLKIIIGVGIVVNAASIVTGFFNISSGMIY